MTPQTTNYEIMQKIEKIYEMLTAHIAENAASAADTSVRLGIIEQSLKQLNGAVYGNGEPGIKERIRAMDIRLNEVEQEGSKPVRQFADRLARLEETHAVCPIVTIAEDYKEIARRHQAEDKAREEETADVKEEKKAEKKAVRDYRWMVLAFVTTSILTIIINYVQNMLSR